MNDRERLILLNLVPEIGSLRLQRLLEAFGDLERLWDAAPEALRQAEGIGPVLAQRIAEYRARPELVREALAQAARHGCEVLTRADAGYPQPLREIHDPPLALYLRGALQEADQAAVAIVGSRHASPYGLMMAERLAVDLAERGITVVSGLARGIDAAAHRGALKAGGRTLAVLGCGLAQVYPPEHEALAGQVAAAGALLSEYAMGAPPLAEHFPRRNRLISGLALGVVVVEAAGRSGALITADCALEQGREVFAVPGRADALTSEGTHRLLKQGAKLVTNVEDILEELPLTSDPAAGDANHVTRNRSRCQAPQPGEVPGTWSNQAAGPAAGIEAVLQQFNNREICDLETLAEQLGWTIPACTAALLQLELKHAIKQLPGQRFVRV
ncbi:MAG: DNA-protecting protein DprA [Candidatus Omnitrophica bacterium]|nr:DNA-protecting protein DprA [Candidatus Omnitrophota bacterium]